MRRWNYRWALLAALAALAGQAQADTPAPAPPTAPSADEMAALIGDLRAEHRHRGTIRFAAPTANAQETRFALQDDQGREAGWLAVSRTPQDNAKRSTHFSYRIEAWTDGEEVPAMLIEAAERIRKRDGPIATDWHGISRPSLPTYRLLAGGLWAVVLAVLAATRRIEVTGVFQRNHLVPALLQTSIFTYWRLYDPQVNTWIPVLLGQLAFAYLVDLTLQLAVYRKARLTFQPLPIVFSANLFEWYLTPRLMVLLIVAAFASKHLLRRNGRHIFNPSAFGLSVVGIGFLIAPSLFVSQPVDQGMTLAPNIIEVILLLALVAQRNFPIVLVSLGVLAGAKMVAWDFFTRPCLTQPLTVLAIALLMTDPATMPRQPLSKLLYGIWMGIWMVVLSTALTRTGHPDGYSKVFPIAIANLSLPAIEQLGERLTQRFGDNARVVRWLAPQYNRRHVAIWFAYMAIVLMAHKGDSFRLPEHWHRSTPWVHFDEKGVPRCDNNPAYCGAFAFWAEWEMRGAAPSRSRQ